MISTRTNPFTAHRLDVTAPADGTYAAVATSYEPGRTGAYRLRIWVRDGE